PLLDPRAAASDSRGNFYVLERNGNALRMVDRTGKIRTLITATSGAHPPRSSKGAAIDMKGPKHLTVDPDGNVLIADTENHMIRMYNPKDGNIEVIAGTGEKGSRIVEDDPLQTQFNRPHGVYVDRQGALWVSDSDNHRILKLTNWR